MKQKSRLRAETVITFYGFYYKNNSEQQVRNHNNLLLCAIIHLIGAIAHFVDARWLTMRLLCNQKGLCPSQHIATWLAKKLH